MKYAPRKVYIKEGGSYVELSYMDFCRRRQADQGYMDKLFIPVQGCLLEVVREQYADFYKDKERWRYLKKLDTNHSLHQKEQLELEIESRLKEVTETLNESYEKSQGIRDFLSLIRNYQGIKELDATIVNALIDKILVSEREKSADGTVKQEIKISYKFIGFVGELHITPTKRWTALPPKNCTVCGVEYVPGSAISKYCPICAKKVQRKKSNESKRRSRTRDRQVCIELSAKNDRLMMPIRNNNAITKVISSILLGCRTAFFINLPLPSWQPAAIPSLESRSWQPFLSCQR